MALDAIPAVHAVPDLPATVLNHRADRAVVPIASRYCHWSSRCCDGRKGRRWQKDCLLTLERAAHQLDGSLLQVIVIIVVVVIIIGEGFAHVCCIISVSIAAAITASPILA